jgi:hypothetical protein
MPIQYFNLFYASKKPAGLADFLLFQIFLMVNQFFRAAQAFDLTN